MNTLKITKSNVVTRTLAFVLAVAVILGFIPSTEKAVVVKAASKVYSETQSFVNPISSGQVSYTYTDGKVTYSNTTKNISEKVMTPTDVAAVNNQNETAVAFDEYGTLWVIYRNGSLYWYNADILGTKGVLCRWMGMSDKEDIVATNLKFYGTKSYYATHYFSAWGMDKPLPTWNELYKLVNNVDYSTTTQAPVTTAQVPTTQATPVTTAQVPTTQVNPSSNTTTINTTFDIEFWWKRYIEGTITWEQLENILWKYNWTAQETSKETSTTYYFYDETGKLIKQVTETNGSKNETGTGVGQATAAASGSATVKIAENGSGNAHGTVTTTIDNSTTIINNTSSNAIVKDKKNFWETTRQGDKVRLWKTTVKTVNGKIESYRNNVSTAVFNEKKGTVKWNGKTYKNVKKCQFIKKSHNLLLIFKNGKAYSYPCGKGKSSRKYLGKNIKTYKCVSSTYNKGLATSLVKKGKTKLINIVGK